MSTMSPATSLARNDPRHLRAMFDRAADLARVHQVPSVFVGVVGAEGDLMVRDFLDFVEAELRVEDSVFRLLRERSVLLLTDVDRAGAEAVLHRLCADFAARFGTAREVALRCGYHQVGGGEVPTAKDVLPRIFDPELAH